MARFCSADVFLMCDVRQPLTAGPFRPDGRPFLSSKPDYHFPEFSPIFVFFGKIPARILTPGCLPNGQKPTGSSLGFSRAVFGRTGIFLCCRTGPKSGRQMLSHLPSGFRSGEAGFVESSMNCQLAGPTKVSSDSLNHYLECKAEKQISLYFHR